MQKRGWNDGSSKGLEEEKEGAELDDRDDLVTWFDVFDAEERPPRKKTATRRKRRA
jgi:hypothetical protein